MLLMGIWATSNEKATTTVIDAFDGDVMTTWTVTTAGARPRCPRTHEHHGGWEWRQSQINGSLRGPFMPAAAMS